MNGAPTSGAHQAGQAVFFGNYEQVYSPSESTQDRTFLTPGELAFSVPATDGSCA
jgi:hypothetical protein